jgi:hypothetical protein
MFEEWFKNRVKDIVAEANPAIKEDIERAAQVMAPLGKALVGLFLSPAQRRRVYDATGQESGPGNER